MFLDIFPRFNVQNRMTLRDFEVEMQRLLYEYCRDHLKANDAQETRAMEEEQD